MARAHRAALIATLTTVTYLLLFFNVFPVPLLNAKIAEQILPVVRNFSPCSRVETNLLSLQIPWWLLVTFGSYCLWSIGMGLVTLKECPEAYNELLVVSSFLCSSEFCHSSYFENFAHHYLTILNFCTFSSRISQKRKMI